MSQKQANPDIRCRVESCEYHCGEKDFCSLNCIQVEPCHCKTTGNAADETSCGSYRHR